MSSIYLKKIKKLSEVKNLKKLSLAKTIQIKINFILINFLLLI